MDKSRLMTLLDNTLDVNEDTIYDKLVKIDDIAQRLLRQESKDWNGWDFIHLFSHIKHINKKLASIKSVYDIKNAINKEL
jgi:hypothetical protein